MSDEKLAYFPNLDGLRFFAFVFVFLTHCFSGNTQGIVNLPVYEFALHFFANGALGVVFFFVLSGYLITYLLLQEEKVNGKINILYFYFRRALRIWPLYFLCVFLGFVLLPITLSLLGKNWPIHDASPVSYIFFLSNFDILKNGHFPPFIGVLWSVSIEEQFYIAWPLLLIFLNKYRLLMLSLTIAASIIFRSWYWNDEMILSIHTLGVISSLAIGGLVAWISHYYPDFTNKIKSAPLPFILLIYVALGILLLFRDTLNDFALYRVLDTVLFSLLFGCVILEQNHARHSLFKLKNFRIASKLGRISYGLYCYHLICIIAIDFVFVLFNFNDHLLSFLFIKPLSSLLLSILLSWISFHWFESWFLSKKRRFRVYSSNR